MRRLWILGLLLCATLPLAAQTGAKNGEWRSYAAEPGSTKYSPLDQINRDNVKNLRIAWRFKTDNLGPRPDFNMQSVADRREQRDVRAGRHAPHRRRARSGERRDAVDVAHGRGEARRSGAAAGLGPRPRLLDRRQGRRAHRHRHARLSHGPAQREDRRARRVVRTKRRRRSQDRDRSARHRSRDRRHRPQLAAGARQQRHRRRRRSSSRRRAAREGERQGLHPRLRRAHRQASVDLPHDSAAGRVRQRHVGKRFVVVHRQRRQLGADHDR